MIRVLLAEDMDLIRGAIAALLGLESDIELVAQVERGDEVLPLARQLRPDVAVVDIGLPGLDGLQVCEQLAHELPECQVLILTGLGQPGMLLRAMRAHARGFVVKDTPADSLADSIRRVAAGERVVDPVLVAAALETGTSPLTPRETEVLRAAEGGASTDEVARHLQLSPATVQNYLSNVIIKTHAKNRTDALRICREAGWL
jgi:two-component system response regulator DesR